MSGIYVGNSEVTDVYVGSTPIQEVYVGSTKVWEKASTVWYRWYDNISTYIYTKFRNPTSRNFDDPATEESNYYVKQDSPGGGYDMNVGGYISGAYGVDDEVNYIRVDGQGSPNYGYDGEGVL